MGVHDPALKTHLAKTKMNGLNNTMLIQEPLNYDRLFDLLPVVMTEILLIANFHMLQTLELWGVSNQKCIQDSRSVFIIQISLIKKNEGISLQTIFCVLMTTPSCLCS